MVVGSGPDCTVPLTGEASEPRHAIVQGLENGSAAIRRCAGAEVLVNGVRLGDDPTPVLHGDKIQIGPHELLVVDPARAGHTQFFDSAAFEKFAPPAAGAERPRRPSRPAGASSASPTAGNTRSARPLVFGRDAGADVVVPGNEVSRRHAEIRATEQGYVLVDTSANGRSSTAHRVGGRCVLQRADVIRIGPTSSGSTPTRARRSGPASVPATPVPPTARCPALRHDARHARRARGARPLPHDADPVPAPLASLLVRSGSSRASGCRADPGGEHRARRLQRHRHSRAQRERRRTRSSSGARHLDPERPGLHQRDLRGRRAGDGRGPALAPGADDPVRRGRRCCSSRSTIRPASSSGVGTPDGRRRSPCRRRRRRQVGRRPARPLRPRPRPSPPAVPRAGSLMRRSCW